MTSGSGPERSGDRAKPAAAPSVEPAAAPSRRWFGWLFIALYVVGVLVLGLLPAPQVSLGDTWLPQDKVGHLVVFGGFGVALGVTLRGRRRLVIAALGSTLLGGALELLQALTPHRSAEWLDLLADAVGATLGAALAGALKQPRRP